MPASSRSSARWSSSAWSARRSTRSTSGSTRRPRGADPGVPGAARELRQAGLMPDREEVLSALYGAYRLAWFDQPGMAAFQPDRRRLLALVLRRGAGRRPAYAMLVAQQVARRGGSVRSRLRVLSESIGYVLGWGAFPAGGDRADPAARPRPQLRRADRCAQLGGGAADGVLLAAVVLGSAPVLPERPRHAADHADRPAPSWSISGS